MKPIRNALLVLVSFLPCTVLAVWWQDYPYLYTDGIGHNDIGHPSAAFIVHEVGDTSKPLIYSFYAIADPHIGGLMDPYKDYNKPGWDKHYDPDYGHIPEGGGPPGWNLSWAVQLINQHYQHSDGEGRFCVVLGDLSNSAERGELEHAKMKLDSLDCPWAPINGNHDTYPYAGGFLG